MDPAAIDAVRLNFQPRDLVLINAVIGLMMFGMSLDLKVEDFKRIALAPKAPAIGLAAQFLLLPFFSFLLTLAIDPVPSMALGMILVGSCPGGNLSNIVTYLARGNAAISVSMTAVSTAAAILMTPLNLAVWGSLNPATEPILRAVALSPLDVLTTIVLILGIPLALGLTVSRLFPGLVERVRKPFKILSVLIFFAVVVLALKKNWEIFLAVIGLVMLGVFLQNAMALGLGYSAARLFRLPNRDARAVTIEVGIQNSALALILVFNFFEGLGGMAIIAAWWGVWHIVAGLAVAGVWSRRLPGEGT
jgi:bile acid:Na+ symporter, BASS family